MSQARRIWVEKCWGQHAARNSETWVALLQCPREKGKLRGRGGVNILGLKSGQNNGKLAQKWYSRMWTNHDRSLSEGRGKMRSLKGGHKRRATKMGGIGGKETPRDKRAVLSGKLGKSMS